VLTGVAEQDSPQLRRRSPARRPRTVPPLVAASGHPTTMAGTGPTQRQEPGSRSQGGALIATTSEDRTTRIWDTATGDLRATLTGHQGYVYGVAFSPDGTLIAPPPPTAAPGPGTPPPAQSAPPSPATNGQSGAWRSPPTAP
jgi:hypothetical protein